jgi:hypothetical protein
LYKNNNKFCKETNEETNPFSRKELTIGEKQNKNDFYNQILIDLKNNINKIDSNSKELHNLFDERLVKSLLKEEKDKNFDRFIFL